MNKKKTKLIEAFSLHISLMADLIIKPPNQLELGDLVTLDLLQKSWQELLKFTDATDKAVRCCPNTIIQLDHRHVC